LQVPTPRRSPETGDAIAMAKWLEGFGSKAYLDTGKALTIGHGHTSDSDDVVKPGAVIREATPSAR
jgi:GH24 family phage-related lysozyme (muramidase)